MKLNYRGLLVVSFVATISAALILLRPSLTISEGMMVKIDRAVEAHKASVPSQCVKTKGEDMAIIESADGPLELGAAPTRIPLIPSTKIAPQRNTLSARVAKLDPERRIY